MARKKQAAKKPETPRRAPPRPAPGRSGGDPEASARRRMRHVARSLRRASDHLAAGEVSAASRELALGVHGLLQEGRTARAEAVLGQLALLPPVEGALEQRLGRACLEADLYEAGARHLMRAERAFEAGAALRRAEGALLELDAYRAVLGPRTLATLAEAWAARGKLNRAAEILVDAADRARRTGRAEESVSLCRWAQALLPSVAGAERVLGLALLALGDPLSALTHLERWSRESGDADAYFWIVEACWTARAPREELEIQVRELAQRLGIHGPDELPIPGLEARLVEHLSAHSDVLHETRLAPFWEAEEIVGEGSEGEASAAPGPTPGHRRPRVFLAEDAHWFRLRLSQILEQARLEVLRKPEGVGLIEALQALAVAPDLVILPLAAARPETLERLRELREIDTLRSVPVLGITTLDRSGLDLDELRRCGVAGLVDKSAIPEQLAFRVNEIVHAEAVSRRRHARAPVFFPVDLDAAGEVSGEYALNLSVGGMLITSTRPLDPNTPVRVRFRLPGQDRSVEASGRVIYRKRGADDGPDHVGVFFDPLDETAASAVACEVEAIRERF